MAKSFGQFDQGAGQRYAEAGKRKKKSANPNPDPPKPTSSGRARAVENLAEQTRAEMKARRRRVLRTGLPG